MKREFPPSDGQTIVTEVLQRSNVCFYWNMLHEQLTASKLTASIGHQLQSTTSIRKRRFVEEQNNYSTYSNGYRKRLVLPSSKLRGNKKLEKKESCSAKEITKPQKNNTKKRKQKDTGGRSERLILICVVSIVWAIAVIIHPFFKDDIALTAVSSAFVGVLGYHFGSNHFGSKKQ